MSRGPGLAGLLAADASAQSAALAAGEISAELLVRAQLEAIARLDPVLNCFVHLDAGGALAAAREADRRRARGEALGPLDGLTLGVKDNIDVGGMPTTAGFGAVLRTPAADAPAVAALRRAGCVVLGKLNMHEAALGSSNDNPHLGRCGNPHRPEASPGGSSGGSGAAVAAGLCALALGSDTMGSVRIPASCCGVVGLKAGIDVVPVASSVACCRRLDHIGPLARSVRDIALVLPALARFPLAPAAVPARIGLMGAIDAPALAPGVAAALAAAARAATAAGFTVVEQSLAGFDFSRARRGGLVATEADVYVENEALLRERPGAISPELRGLLDWIEGRSALDLARAEARIDAARQWLLARLAECEVLLWPTSPDEVFDFDAPHPATHADFTCVANMAGVPAISLPAGVDARGLPVGVQLIGRPGAEATLLDIAAALAAQLPAAPLPAWHAARPSPRPRGG